MDCDVPTLHGHQYGAKVKCKDCHSSYRFCRENVPDWGDLTPEDRKKYILKNKGKGGRGKKRVLQKLDEDSKLDLSALVLYYVGPACVSIMSPQDITYDLVQFDSTIHIATEDIPGSCG